MGGDKMGLVGFGQPDDGIIQMAYVVPDVRAAMSAWVEKVKVGPWFLLEHFTGNDLVFLAGVPTGGRVAYMDTTADLPGYVELIELGGDEVVLGLGGLPDQSHVDVIMQKIFGELRGNIQLSGRTVYSTCSIGISIAPRDGTDSSTLHRSVSNQRLYRECARWRALPSRHCSRSRAYAQRSASRLEPRQMSGLRHGQGRIDISVDVLRLLVNVVLDVEVIDDL